MNTISCIRLQADEEQILRCQKQLSHCNQRFESLSEKIQLAGNAVRLKILFLLQQEQRLCVCDMSDILGMNVSAISQHLRKLKDRGLIETEREAQTIFYSLKTEFELLMKPFFEILMDEKTQEA
jgi:DNA-binding transcriptional ArsR family regulator